MCTAAAANFEQSIDIACLMEQSKRDTTPIDYRVVSSALFAQLKQGQISKGELFAQLSQLNRNRILGKSGGTTDIPNPRSPPKTAWPTPKQKNSREFQNEEEDQSPNPETESHSPGSARNTSSVIHLNSSFRSTGSQGTNSISGFTAPSRRAIIQRLMEEKKKNIESLRSPSRERGTQMSSPPSPSFSRNGYEPEPSTAPFSYSLQGDDEHGDTYLQAEDPILSPASVRSASSAPGGSEQYSMLKQGAGSAEKTRPTSAPRSRPARQPTSSAPRMIQRQLNNPEKSMDEEQLLANYGYYAAKRVEQSQTYSRALQSQESVRQELMRQCTFRPAVKELPAMYGPLKDRGVPFYDRNERWRQEKTQNEESQRLARACRELEECTFTPNINETSLMAAAMIKEAKGLQDFTTAERLYVDGENHLETVAQKVGMLKEQLDNAKHQECTFQPNTSLTKQSAAGIRASSRIYGSQSEEMRALNRSQIQAQMEQDLTFHPATLGPKPNMLAAKEYLKENVFSRLSRTGDPEQDPELEESAQRKTQTMANIGYDTFLKSLEISNSQSFQEFLARQKQLEVRKETHKKTLELQITPNFQPKICTVSNQMMEMNHKGDFLQRVARDALRKEHELVRQKGEKKVDPECTFKPEINKKSKVLEARSSIEMSRGDSLKKETTLRLTKLRADQQAFQDTTFRPKVNNNYSMVSSKLKVTSELETYMRRLQESSKLDLEKRKKALTQKETEEQQESTFKPKIKECPSYIKKMAEGLAKGKATQQPSNERGKPDWR